MLLPYQKTIAQQLLIKFLSQHAQARTEEERSITRKNIDTFLSTLSRDDADFAQQLTDSVNLLEARASKAQYN